MKSPHLCFVDFTQIDSEEYTGTKSWKLISSSDLSLYLQYVLVGSTRTWARCLFAVIALPARTLVRVQHTAPIVQLERTLQLLRHQNAFNVMLENTQLLIYQIHMHWQTRRRARAVRVMPNVFAVSSHKL